MGREWTTSVVGVALTTSAAMLEKNAWFSLSLVLKPEPEIVISVPGAPVIGVIDPMLTSDWTNWVDSV